MDFFSFVIAVVAIDVTLFYFRRFTLIRMYPIISSINRTVEFNFISEIESMWRECVCVCADAVCFICVFISASIKSHREVNNTLSKLVQST